MKYASYAILVAFGIAMAVYWLNDQQRVPPSVISSGKFAHLQEKFDRLNGGEPSMASLVVNLNDSPGDFIQFSVRDAKVEIDFPLFTDRQKDLESDFRKICTDSELPIEETTDPEGNRILHANLGSDPAELSRIAGVFLRQLFDANEDSWLDFTLHPLPR